MSITSFGHFVVILLCIRGCSAAIQLSAPPARVGFEVNLTCTINPAEAITWKNDTHSLAICDRISCAVISSPTRYTFNTYNGGLTVNMTIYPVETDDINTEFKCETSTSSNSHTLIAASTTTETPGANGSKNEKMWFIFFVLFVPFAGLLCFLKTKYKFGMCKGNQRDGNQRDVAPGSGNQRGDVPGSEALEHSRREFKTVDELNQLKQSCFFGVEDKRGATFELVCVVEYSSSATRNKRLTTQETNPIELVCVIQVSANQNETLTIKETNTFANHLKFLLADLQEAVTLNKDDCTLKLTCRSMNTLLAFINLMQGDKWNKFPRNMEQKHQNTTLMTQVDADSFNACDEYIKGRLREKTGDVPSVKTNVNNN